MICQIAIAIFGISAVWLSQEQSAERRKWAPVMGLLGQPFWLQQTASTHQWGMFVLCLVYTLVWARGFYNQWLKGNFDD